MESSFGEENIGNFLGVNSGGDTVLIPHSWIWDLLSFVFFVLIVIWVFFDFVHNDMDRMFALCLLIFIYVHCHIGSMNTSLNKIFDYFVPLGNINEKYNNYFEIETSKRLFKIRLIGVVTAPFVFVCVWITTILTFIAFNILCDDIVCDPYDSNDTSDASTVSSLDNIGGSDIDLIKNKCDCELTETNGQRFAMLTYKGQSTESINIVIWWHVVAGILHTLTLFCTCMTVFWRKKQFERLGLLFLSLYGMMAIFSGIVPIYYGAQVSDAFGNCVNNSSYNDRFQLFFWMAFLASFIRDCITFMFNFYMLNKKPSIKRSKNTPWYK